METRIQSVHFDASAQLLEFVEKKVGINLMDIMQNSDAKIINMLTAKLPFQNNNMFENIYSLYKGIISNDISQWLGADNITELLSDSVNSQKYISDLGNMLQNSLKETPNWRIVEIPFFDGEQLSAVKIALKKDKEQKEKSKDKKATRYKPFPM